MTQALEHNKTLVASQATLAQTQVLALAHRRVLGTRKWTSPPVWAVSSTAMSFWADWKNTALYVLRRRPTVSYTLDYIGGVARSVKQQHALAEVERHQLHAACLTVTGQAVMQALAIASARTQIATVETILPSSQPLNGVMIAEATMYEVSTHHLILGCRDRALNSR